MVKDVEGIVSTLIRIGIDIITIPVEQIVSIAFRVIAQIKSAGLRVGIALNPITPIESLEYILPLIDKVTVLTVDPGLVGQDFIAITLKKVSALVRLRDLNDYDYDIEVDGSCNEMNYISMLNSGANQFVVGTSGLFSLDRNVEIAWKKMKYYMDS
jgi:D-allulose-6-phosphate 3-epimerase